MKLSIIIPHYNGSNLLENLLFWTDNRNQPRKINITRPLGYYTTEDHISVAKFAPYEAINLYQESSVAGEYETTMKDVVSPNYPDGTTNPYKNPTYAGDPDYLEDKFVRFSYRFRYDDNEYSVLAPFTLVAPFSQIGENCFMNSYSSIGHHSIIGKSNVLSPYSTVNGNCSTISVTCF